MQVACDILLEHSRQWLQLCFRFYFNRRFTHKVVKVPTLGISRFPFGSPRQNDIWVLVPWLGTKYTIRGKVVASPSLGRGEFCESVFVCGESVHQNVLITH